jgi:excisionase family DNA binding protein
MRPATSEARDASDAGRHRIPPLLLTVTEAATALAIGRTMLYELIAGGRIEVVHIGRCTRVPIDALQTFVDEQRAG